MLSKELSEALKAINNSLLKKLGAKPIVSVSLKNTKMTVQQSWFHISSSEKADALDVAEFMEYVEKLSLPLLDYCVNMIDSNVSQNARLKCTSLEYSYIYLPWMN